MLQNSRIILRRNSNTRRWMSDGPGGRGGRGPSSGRGAPGRGRGALERFTAPRSPPQFANPMRGGRGEFGNTRGGRGSIQKPNFAKTFLDPAARGELVGHSSGIPKLAARVGKSSAIKNDYGQKDDDFVARNNSISRAGPQRTRPSGRSGRGGRGNKMIQNLDPNRLDYPNLTIEEYLRPKPGYDSEDDYDELVSSFDESKIEGTEPDGTVILRETPSDYEDSDDEAEGWEEVEGNSWAPRKRKNLKDSENDDGMEDFYFKDLMDMDEEDPVARLPEAFINTPIPLNVKGSTLEHFLEATIEHPTKYGVVSRMNHHPESLRRGKPIIPASRAEPDLEFIHGHIRFAFVTGLPHYVTDDDEAGDMDNPIHKYSVASLVANLFGVESKQVSPASMGEAYVGFTDKKQRDQFMSNGPKESLFVRPLKMAAYKGKDYADFCQDAPSAVIRLTNVPSNLSPGRLAYTLFPAGSELEQIYGSLPTANVLKTSATTMLFKLKSEAEAVSVLASVLVLKRLEQLGTHKIQYFKAKRDLVLKGFTGPANGQANYLRGDKMMAVGDAPSDEFMRCHASVLQIRGVDDDWTKEELTHVFQQFSRDKRDVLGSIEFVTCARGEKTGRAYVGFDRNDEAKAFMEKTKGHLVMSVPSKPPIFIHAKAVKERYVPGQVLREERPERTTEELLADLEWTNFVKKEDIDYLEAAGIAPAAIRDAFRVLRFQNQTFGFLDQNIARERVNPSQARGQQIREAMQYYVDALKENIATPENPGDTFLAFFEDDEEKDYSIFEDEKQRIALLQKKRTFEN